MEISKKKNNNYNNRDPRGKISRALFRGFFRLMFLRAKRTRQRQSDD